MRTLATLSLATAALLAGCNFNATTSMSNASLNTEAEAVLNDLVAGRDEAIVARMSSSNDPNQIRAQLPMLRTMLGDCQPTNPVVDGTQTNISNQGRTYVVAQTYSCPDRQVAVTSTFIQQGEVWKLHGFNVNANMAPVAPRQTPDDTPAPSETATATTT